jgi:hypothetical protein
MIRSAEEFVRLRQSELHEEYSRAADEDAPISVWRDVIARFPAMKEWVAHNKTVPLEILEVLATDEDARVRCVVATKRKLSTSLFERLAADSDETVRERLVWNRKTPSTIIERLTSDPSGSVREAAYMRLRKADSPSGSPSTN